MTKKFIELTKDEIKNSRMQYNCDYHFQKNHEIKFHAAHQSKRDI